MENKETISSLIEKTKKGCGRGLFKREGGKTRCGEEYIPKSPYVVVDKLRLCPTCQAKLQAYEECVEMIESYKQRNRKGRSWDMMSERERGIENAIEKIIGKGEEIK